MSAQDFLAIDDDSLGFIATIALDQGRDVAGATHRRPLGNPRPLHRRLPAPARGQGDFLRVAFGPRGQVGFGSAVGVHPGLEPTPYRPSRYPSIFCSAA